jgi:hypothetical protein
MNAELLAAVKALPRDQKVELLGEVWASLDDSFDPPISSAQATELDAGSKLSPQTVKRPSRGMTLRLMAEKL